jgi:hypothetical protein
MGRTCGTYGERSGAYRALVWKPEGRRPLGSPGLDGRIILRRIFVMLGGGDVDWIKLAEDRGRWRALVCTALNLRVP